MRSATPTIDPAATHKEAAAMRKMAGKKDQPNPTTGRRCRHPDDNARQASDHNIRQPGLDPGAGIATG